MISYLIGQVKEIGEKSLTLLVGGVGYEVHMIKTLLSKYTVRQELELHIITVVREDAFDLYGFDSREMVYLFKLLNSISGIGPKSALSILDSATPADIRQAVIDDDPTLLYKVNGIGKKTAERIVVELKSKIGTGLSTGDRKGDISEVIEALTSLGYRLNEVKHVIKQIDPNLSVEEKIKHVLKNLAR